LLINLDCLLAAEKVVAVGHEGILRRLLERTAVVTAMDVYNGISDEKQLGNGKKFCLVCGQLELSGQEIKVKESFTVDALVLDDVGQALVDLDQIGKASDFFNVPVQLARLQDAGLLVNSSDIGAVDCVADQKAHKLMLIMFISWHGTKAYVIAIIAVGWLVPRVTHGIGSTFP
jgi:hypothetical protein